jgi:hypothetical protein
MGADALKIGGGAAIVIVFYIIARLFCIWGPLCPADGNPVGFHFHGAAKIDPQTALSLSGCANNSTGTQCTLYFEVAIGKKGTQPTNTPAPCSSSDCFNFSGDDMWVQSEDDYYKHDPDTGVKAVGYVRVSRSADAKKKHH